MEVARNAPTSHFLPQCPIVRVPDLQLREQIRSICHQQYVGTNSDLQVLWLIYIVTIVSATSLAWHLHRYFIQSAQEAMIAAQSVVIAAESMG